jgi:Phage integrase family
MMMTAMAISPMMRNVLRVATMLPTDVMASDTATIAPTIVPMIRRMSPLCAPGPLAGYGRAGPSRIWRWAASLMIQAGYPPKMLQEIMGHASITTTLDLYGHLYPGDMDRYADRLGDAAEEADAAKMWPDHPNNDVADEGPGL